MTDHPPTVSKEAREIARRIVREFRPEGWPAKEDEIARLIDRHFEAHLRTPASGEAGEMVERLRETAHAISQYEPEASDSMGALCVEAADLITRLSNDTEAMRQKMMEALDEYHEPMSMLNSHERGERLADRIDALAKGGAS